MDQDLPGSLSVLDRIEDQLCLNLCCSSQDGTVPITHEYAKNAAGSELPDFAAESPSDT